MSLHVPHVPEPANEAANKFARLLDRDGYGPTVAMRMIAAIVDHARAVRLRCDAREHLSIVEENGDYDESYQVETIGACVAEQARIVHGLARHTTVMTRRDVPRLETPTRYLHVTSSDDNVTVTRVPLMTTGCVSEATRDAGHDLLASLICEVDCG